MTLALAWPACGAAGKVDVAVDPRFELMFILFRLAGHPEYNQTQVDAYAREVDDHFGPYQGHRVVALARMLRRNHGISFDAPMSLACHLKEGFLFEERMPLTPLPETLDERWAEAEPRRFLELVREFATDTSFREFFDQHQEIYSKSEQQMIRLLEDEANLEWFDAFFGVRPGARFHLSPALLSGACCYGPRVKLGDTEEFFCAMGVWKIDGSGMPVFDKTVLPTVVHEFCHSYSNPIVARHLDELEPAGQRIFPEVASRMASQAYGSWKSMMYESFVRASVVRYLLANDEPGVADRKIREEESRGFLWTRALVKQLDTYEADRDTYPTLEDFMPEIVTFFDTWADTHITEE